MYDYVLSLLWWFMWTPVYIQLACMVFGICLVGLPLMNNFQFQDIMACLCMLGILCILFF